jgi:hypothetical protein
VNVEYHPAVERDVAEAFKRYDAVSPVLGDEFKKELRQLIALAAANPGKFHPAKTGFRRANLRRFPYHFLYRELPDGIRGLGPRRVRSIATIPLGTIAAACGGFRRHSFPTTLRSFSQPAFRHRCNHQPE